MAAGCLVAVLLIACAAPRALAQAGLRAPATLPVPEVERRASEAGAWWAVVQAACEPDAAQALLSAMNRALFDLAGRPEQAAIVERLEDPHLDEPMRLRMEAVMRRATALRRTVHAPASAAGASPPAPQATRAARDLAAECDQARAALRAALLDPPSGLVPALR